MEVLGVKILRGLSAVNTLTGKERKREERCPPRFAAMHHGIGGMDSLQTIWPIGYIK